MTFQRLVRAGFTGGIVILLAACGGREAADQQRANQEAARPYSSDTEDMPSANREAIWSLFRESDDPNTRIAVNKYIWNASLDVLDFLPVESVDPFSGVIVTGYGTPPGGGRAYRATVYVQDPALDARSLRVALQTSGGSPASAETTRAIEDAILTRARQLRIADSKL
ncbi:DUF3576 domain-containing protein [Falsirhodobacter xinxiangensis]|uniref:DUF3576 domain-containing protein n=1 Tax=Falsirhodobacter xinxiangensis TaxID=2530049 RepID=UPI0010AACFA3|nr:DUF3576 domain-containing protein [Rhodobacter xinxiangensis]